jgi:hypothetical protein
MLESPCPLCRLFATLLPRGQKRVHNTFVLKKFSALQHHFRYTYKSKQIQDTTILSLAPLGAVRWKPQVESKRGMIYLANKQGISQDQSILGKKIESRRIDYDMAKRWIQYCRVEHKGYCKDQGLTTANVIPGFKTIDCNARRIAEHTSQHGYVALSYVWGTSSHASTRSLPSPAARVIEDAITVTKRLGYQYLWVDRYCISQTDAVESREQITRMDQIYADAVVTLVAAAGEGPHYGLPGVSHTSRRQQPGVVVANFHLVSTLESPRDVVLSSKWASRGWTFQEMKLSRRTLFFTDDQMFFECANMSCQETICMPLVESHCRRSASMGRECNKARIFPPNGPGKSVITVLDVIPEYTSRSLTHESDNLNALLGVFNAFGKSSDHRISSSKSTSNTSTPRTSAQLHQIWGLPVLPAGASGLRELSMDHSFCAMLAWQSDSPSTRSPGFPSWSWTGWKLPHKITFSIRGGPLRLYFTFPDSPLKTWLYMGETNIIALNDIEHQADIAGILKQASPFLIMRGHIRKFRFRRTQDAKFPLEPVGYPEETLSFWSDIKMSSNEVQNFVDNEWDALNITWGLMGLHWLVLRPLEFGYERIGIIGGVSNWYSGYVIPSRQSSSNGELIVLR